MKIIFEYLNSIIPTTEKEMEEIVPFLRTRIIEKNDYLLRSDEICKSMAFIKSGSFRVFHIKANGEPVNIMLNSANEFVSDLDSFLSGSKSNVNIQAIEKSEIITLYKDDLNTLYENSLYWNTLGRKMTEGIFIVSKKRLETLLYKTPQERYMELMENSPEFFNMYSLTDLSRFIGITPQSLSRIRTKN